jgi:hypothetical protein
MVKYILILLLAGCASTPQVEYRVIDVPEPPVIQRPELPVLNIKPGDDAGTVLQLHRETIKVLQSFAKELETALNAYRKKEVK